MLLVIVMIDDDDDDQDNNNANMFRWRKPTKPSLKHWSSESDGLQNSYRGSKKYLLFDCSYCFAEVCLLVRSSLIH